MALASRPVAASLQLTDRGYDNLNRSDAICWSAIAQQTNSSSDDEIAMGGNCPSARNRTSVPAYASQIWYSDLLPSGFDGGETRMHKACPAGMTMQLVPSTPAAEDLNTVRVQSISDLMNFTLKATLNESALQEEYGFGSLHLGQKMEARLMACPQRGQFCSPFLNSGDEKRASTVFAMETYQMPSQSTTPDEKLVRLEIPLQLSVREPGTFLVLGSLHFFLGNSTSYSRQPLLKFDMANLSSEAAMFTPEADIRSVHFSVRALAFLLIGAANVVQLVLLFYTVRYRNECVMKLSQGRFLILLQLAGIVASSAAFLFEPKSDMYCMLAGPLILIPAQFMLAIVFSRLWRVVTILSNLMEWCKHQDEPTSPWDRFRTFLLRNAAVTRRSFRTSDQRGTNHSLRKDFSVKWLWATIIVLTLPQIVAQTIGLTLFPPNLELALDPQTSIGRYECGSRNDRWYQFGSIMIAFITTFAAVFEAQQSRKLPGLFNEAASVSAALSSTIFVCTIAFCVAIASDDPRNLPDLPFIMLVVIVLTLSVNLSVRLVLPKLRLIWSGEKVVVSKIIAEHRESQKQNQMKASSFIRKASNMWESTRHFRKNRRTKMTRITEDDNDIGSSSHSELRYVGEASVEDDVGIEAQPPKGTAASTSDLSFRTASDGALDEEYRVAAAAYLVDLQSNPEPPRERVVGFKLQSLLAAKERVVLAGHAPPSEVTSSIFHLTKVLNKLNERILSDLQVSKNDWDETQQALRKCNQVLEATDFR